MKAAVLALLALAAATAVAAELPSHDAVYSCMAGRSLSPSVQVRPLDMREFSMNEQFSRTYRASYLIAGPGGELGYLEPRQGDGEDAALTYRHRVFPLRNASPLLATRSVPSAFEPSLATWAALHDSGRAFVCVSFNFGGLGRSGEHQYVRGAYLLPLRSPAGPLYYGIGDLRAYTRYAGLPADVRAFVERRDLCDHLRGESAGDTAPTPSADEGVEIARACQGTDADELRALRQRHESDSQTLQVLDKYAAGMQAPAASAP